MLQKYLNLIPLEEIKLMKKKKYFGKSKKGEIGNIICFYLLIFEKTFPSEISHPIKKEKFKKYSNRFFEIFQKIEKVKIKKELEILTNLFILIILDKDELENFEINKKIFKCLKKLFLEFDLDGISYFGLEFIKIIKFPNLLSLLIKKIENSEKIELCTKFLILFCQISETFESMLNNNFIFKFEEIIESFNLDQLVRGFSILNKFFEQKNLKNLFFLKQNVIKNEKLYFQFFLNLLSCDNYLVLRLIPEIILNFLVNLTINNNRCKICIKFLNKFEFVKSVVKNILTKGEGVAARNFVLLDFYLKNKKFVQNKKIKDFILSHKKQIMEKAKIINFDKFDSTNDLNFKIIGEELEVFFIVEV